MVLLTTMMLGGVSLHGILPARTAPPRSFEAMHKDLADGRYDIVVWGSFARSKAHFDTAMGVYTGERARRLWLVSGEDSIGWGVWTHTHTHARTLKHFSGGQGIRRGPGRGGEAQREPVREGGRQFRVHGARWYPCEQGRLTRRSTIEINSDLSKQYYLSCPCPSRNKPCFRQTAFFC